MPTELDTALNTIMDQLSAPGQPFETVEYEDYGAKLPAFKNAPPSLAHYFAHFCNEHKDLTFLVDGDVRLTFGECWQAATHVAAGLAQEHGVKKGDRVGIAARNSANWIIAYMGIIMSGGCATLLNGFWSGDELAYGIRLAECEVVLADEGRAKRLEGTDHSAKIVVFGHDGPPSSGLAPVWGEGDTAMAMLGQLGPDDLATILEALRLSASSINSQPWKFVVVESDEAKQRLHDSFANKHQFNQHHAKEASHTILFAYDPKFTKEKFVKRVDAEVASGHLPEDMRENFMGAYAFAEANTDDNGNNAAWTKAQVYLALGNVLHTLARLGIASTPKVRRSVPR